MQPALERVPVAADPHEMAEVVDVALVTRREGAGVGGRRFDVFEEAFAVELLDPGEDVACGERGEACAHLLDHARDRCGPVEQPDERPYLVLRVVHLRGHAELGPDAERGLRDPVDG